MSQLNVNNITKYTGGEVVVNDASEDVDFRVESDGSTHAVFVDAGSDAVLIGKSGNNDTDAGVRHTTAGYTSIVCSGDTPLTVNRLASDGAIINIQQASATIAQLETEGTSLEIKTAGNNAIVIDNTGAVTKPLQPAFLAMASASQDGLGNGVTITGEFDTEIFDQNADYNTGTYTFTAPVTGRYFLSMNYSIENFTPGSFQRLIVTSNRSYGGNSFMADDVPDCIAVIADMDANDTAVCQWYVWVDTSWDLKIYPNSFFSGYLVA
tara:strand:+ start:199 stop:996 length:798 start_codon:yes stop_codon:yes gene_type:complete